MKKILVFTTVIIILLTTITACGAPATAAPTTAAATTAPATGITLTIWQIPNSPTMAQIMDALVAPFETEHNVKVETIVYPAAQLSTLWASAIQSRVTPSIAYTYDSQLPDFYRMGGLEPLEGYFDKSSLAQFIPVALNSAYYQGHLYALPVITTTDVLYYNKDLFKAAGITDPDDPLYSPTWDEYLGWMQKLAKAGDYGWDTGMLSTWDHPISDFYMRFGCSATNADYTQVTFNTPQCLKAAEAWAELGKTPGLIPPAGLTVDYSRGDAFTAGKAGMVEYYIGMATELEQKYPNIHWGVMRPFHDADYVTYMGMGYYTVFADAKNKDMVIELLKYLTTPTVEESFAKTIGLFPGTVGGETIFDNASPAVQQVASVTAYCLLHDAKFLYPWPGFVEWGNNVFVPNYQKLILGKITPEAFTQTVTAEGNKIIQNP